MAYFVPCTQDFKDAVADPLSARYLKILIDIDDDDVLEDVTDDLDNNYVQGGGRMQGAIGISTKQYTVKLRNSTKKYAEGDFAGAICAIEAKVGTAEYIRFFTGIVSEEGCSRTKRTKSGDYISIQMNDASKSKGMRAKCNPVVYTTHKICDTATPASSLFHKLAALMGLAAGDLETASINQTKDYLPLTQKRTAWQELQDLNAQYIGHMCFRYDGKLRFISRHQTGWTDPVSEWTFNADNIHSPWKGSRSRVVCNRVKTVFENYKNLGQRVIYKDTEEWDSVLERNAIAVPAGDYLPGPNSGDKSQLNYKDPVSGERFPIGITIQTPTIGAVASGSDIECEGGLLTLTSFNGSTSATQQNPGSSEIILHNNTGSTIYVRKFEIRGTALRIQKKVTAEDWDTNVTDDWDYVDKTIPGRYAVSDTQAHVSTQRWVEFGKVKRKIFDYPTDWIPQIQEGAVITFNPDTAINMSAVVESFQHRCSGSIRKWKTIINIREKESFTPSGSAQVIEENLGEAATEKGEQFVTHDEAMTGFNNTPSGGTTTPTQVTIATCKAVATKSILLIWDRQLTLTNFDHYEIQVSDDNATWYSLRFDGVDWKGSLGATTDIDTEFLVHSGIPHTGTADNPSGKTLYYKVRRVTKEPTNGTWSSSASTTTKTVAAGDHAANSIYANNILAAAVQTMLLRAAYVWVGFAGSGTYGSPDEGDRRIYVDDDEIKFQIYTDGAWSTERQIMFGGVDSNSNFRPFLGCRGVLGDITDSPLLDPIPGRGFHLFKFDNDAKNQHGVDPWTVTLGAFVYSTTKWEGTHSLSPSAALLNAYYAANWTIGDSVTACFMFRDDGSAIGHDIIEWGLTADNDRINIEYTFGRAIQVEIEKGGTQTDINSAVLSTGAWHFICFTYNKVTNTGYLRVDANKYSATPAGTWGSGTKSIYLTLAGGTYQRRMDDLLISHDTAMDPDLFFQHVNRNVAWTADYFSPDVLLKPKPGGRIVIDDSDTEPSWGTLHEHKATIYNADPGAGSNVTLDFSGDVPAGTEYVFCRLRASGDATIRNGSIYSDAARTDEWAYLRTDPHSDYLCEYQGILKLDSNYYAYFYTASAFIDNLTVKMRGYWG
jgi:hypothetical protein